MGLIAPGLITPGLIAPGMIAMAVALGLLALYLLTAVLAALHLRRRPAPATPPPPVTVIRPVCGLDHALYDTLASSFGNRGTRCQVLFCVADADDPAIPVIRAVIAAYPWATARLLIGRDRISDNPKLDNMAKGWAAADHDWIAMIDSNVALPPNYLGVLWAAWTPGCGLVTSPPAGVRCTGLAARTEAAFLNGWQNRWQLAADQVGQGFAQGKVLFWHRSVVAAGGGLAALGHEMAEDVAATKLVRGLGLWVALVPRPFAHPLGRRRWSAVWQRQVRWARLRRAGFAPLFALEPLSGLAAPLVAAALACAAGTVPVAALPLLVAVWCAVDRALARAAGWPAGSRDLPALLLREALIPAVWLAALASRRVAWRGHDLTPAPRVPLSHPPLGAAE